MVSRMTKGGFDRLVLQDEEPLDYLATSPALLSPSSSLSDMTLPKKGRYQPFASRIPTPPSSVLYPPNPLSPPESIGDSAYSSPSGPVLSHVAEVNQARVWREALVRVLLTFGISVQQDGSDPQNEQELKTFLESAWKNDIPQPGDVDCPEYMQKIATLKLIYDGKVAEIEVLKSHYIRRAHAIAESKSSMESALLQAEVVRRCKPLQLNLDHLTMKAILSLRARYVSHGKRKHLPQRAIRILTAWYTTHATQPYPSAEDKHFLASQCAITVEQVTTWFSNKRCRSKAKARKSKK